MTVDEIAARFYEELTTGIDGTSIRADWIKIGTTEAGPTKTDTRIHRAAARAAKRAGVTISAHTPFTDATLAVVKTLTQRASISGVSLGACPAVSCRGSHQARATRRDGRI